MTKYIRKVRATANKVDLEVIEKVGDLEQKITLTIKDEPHPDFAKALDALKPLVTDICEVGKEWDSEDITVSGVTWSYKEEHDEEKHGATLVARVKVESCNGPLNIATPHKLYEIDESDAGNTFDAKSIKLIEKVRTEAQAFLDGTKRAQGDLLDKEAA